ncbi:MAG TPA: hypothetical protein VFX76_07120 [Roseiflexaceae bacterium]|nr:hypothetical protein [Roseiflexaceae bacterium]
MNVDMAAHTQGYIAREAEFRDHYQQYQDEHSSSYDQYRPAYRYGYDLGVHTHYGSGSWEQIEYEAGMLWEARNPGTWEQFKGSIQYAWATASAENSFVASLATQR